MPRASIEFVPIGRRGICVTLRTDRGWTLDARGDVDQALPELAGADRLRGNLVVTTNLWAYACAEKERRLTRDQALRPELAKRSRVHAELARETADLVDKVGSETRQAWCSACFDRTIHRKVEATLSLPTFMCDGCGAATLTCVAPRCSNMATRGFGAVRIPRYCLEHRHALPSFERGGARISELSDYSRLLKYEKRNLAKTTKVAGSVIAVAGAMTGVGLVAAPLIGGMIGTTVGGYTGAAATSYGLALLGGGPIAAGGFGMAGGTAVIAAAGAGLGGVIGAGLTSAYVAEDKSFLIEKLRSGDGVAVVVCSGFLTEGKTGWGDWERIVTERFPDSPVYRVHWGAEELRDLTAALGGPAGKALAARAAKKLAVRASKQAAKTAGPIGGALIVADLVKNPWWRARERANKTGAIVSDLIARTNMDEVILVGHSLGARAMLCAGEALGTKKDAPKVREVHLLGAAVGAEREWGQISAAVQNVAFIYHSRNDKVLKFVYSLAQGGSVAAGLVGAKTRSKKVKNVDVTRQVPDHFAYCKTLSLK